MFYATVSGCGIIRMEKEKSREEKGYYITVFNFDFRAVDEQRFLGPERQIAFFGSPVTLSHSVYDLQPCGVEKCHHAGTGSAPLGRSG